MTDVGSRGGGSLIRYGRVTGSHGCAREADQARGFCVSLLRKVILGTKVIIETKRMTAPGKGISKR